MMDFTTRHFRFLCRLLTRRSVLYTEMVAADTLVYRADDCDRWLRYTDAPWPSSPHTSSSSPLPTEGLTEHPIVLQVGGSDPDVLERACRIAAPFGYDAVNLNCGCPSERVAGTGCFGAVLMRDPTLVTDLVLAMRAGLAAGSRAPVTIKCRLGVDDKLPDVETTYENLARFVDTLANGPAQVRRFQIHARKAVLGAKFTPERNREVPPLRYNWVGQLTEDFPDIDFVLNGGVKTVAEAKGLMGDAGLYQKLSGVMCGRAVLNTPWEFATVDRELYDDPRPGLTRREVLAAYGLYCNEQEAIARQEGYDGIRRALLQPLQNLFVGEYHGKAWRRFLETALLDEKYCAMPLSDFLTVASTCVLLDETLDRPAGLPPPVLTSRPDREFLADAF